MIWITRDKEFINDLQQQNKKDFVIRLQKIGSQFAEQQIWWANITNPAIMTLQTAKPSFRTANATTLRTKPEFRPAKTARSGNS